MAFVQIIEIETTRPDQVEALVGEWRSKSEGTRGSAARDLHQGQRPSGHLRADRRVPLVRGRHG